MNEPIAYINVEIRQLEWAKYISFDTPTTVNLEKIPLYTHPKIELTDEEIIQTWEKFPNWGHPQHIVDFGRELIKKANEK